MLKKHSESAPMEDEGHFPLVCPFSGQNVLKPRALHRDESAVRALDRLLKLFQH